MSQNNFQNQLLWKYQQYKQNNIPFQDNALLQNNPIFQNNMNYNNSEQIKQMQMMQMAQMQRIKELQKIKRIEKMNELENNLDKEKVRESIIRPLKINKKDNMDDIIKNAKEKWGINIKKGLNKNKNPYQDISNQITDQLQNKVKEFHKKRTNLPYKNIIKDEKHYKKFVENPLIGKINKTTKKKREKELIVHRVTDADKEGVDEEFDKLQGEIEKHDGELKVIYSSSKEAEHKKKFEYNHKYKYRIKYDPSDHEKMKKDKISILKKEQHKMEKNKKKIDDVIQFLVDDGIFDNEIADSEIKDEQKQTTHAKRKITFTRPNDKEEKTDNKHIKPQKIIISKPEDQQKIEVNKSNKDVKLVKPRKVTVNKTISQQTRLIRPNKTTKNTDQSVQNTRTPNAQRIQKTQTTRTQNTRARNIRTQKIHKPQSEVKNPNTIMRSNSKKNGPSRPNSGRRIVNNTKKNVKI